MGLPDDFPFLAKFHYVLFYATSYARVGWQLKECFLKTSAMESKTFDGFLNSYMVPTMVWVSVYQIITSFFQNSITLNFR